MTDDDLELSIVQCNTCQTVFSTEAALIQARIDKSLPVWCPLGHKLLIQPIAK